MSESTSPRIGASGLDLDVVDKLLTSTRAVRRRLDLTRPVEVDVVMECLRLAIQAPTGSNRQGWRWLLVDDPAVRAGLADLYRNPRRPEPPTATAAPTAPATPAASTSAADASLATSAGHLRDRLHEVPMLVVPCVEDAGGAAGWAPSIYPAVWSLMLALRSRGLGSVITTVHLFRREEAAELLGVPDGYVQACLLPVAYFTGDDFRPADRRPVEELAFLNRWGEPVRT